MLGSADTTAGSLRNEDGFTLTELLVAMVLGLLLVGVGVTVFTAAIRTQPTQNDRGHKVETARTTMERLVRELRQGATVYTATSAQLSFLTWVHKSGCGGASGSASIPCRVTYTCSAGTCTRAEANPDGTGVGAAETVVSGLSNAIVFDYSPNGAAPSYIGATLTFPSQNGDDAITVEDGAALRNPASAPL
jgi:prepilin-type N-terminal cleavage/methylation domain-containing protein